MDASDRDRRWARARQRADAARLCLDHGYAGECVSLSYYGCFQAMWVAVGDPPAGLWRHGGLINEFCRGQWRSPPVAPQTMAAMRRQLDRLYLRRLRADYEARLVTRGDGEASAETLDRVLRLVADEMGLQLE